MPQSMHISGETSKTRYMTRNRRQVAVIDVEESPPPYGLSQSASRISDPESHNLQIRLNNHYQPITNRQQIHREYRYKLDFESKPNHTFCERTETDPIFDALQVDPFAMGYGNSRMNRTGCIQARHITCHVAGSA
mgnify:CR=1 FL=1|jgi:hypothetical protein